jgi:HSP20 family protein
MSPKLQVQEDAFNQLGKQINWIIEEMGQRSYYKFSKRSVWQPALNVYEDERQVQLCLELAGLAKDQIHVEIADNKLIIRGQRPVPPPPGSDKPGCIVRIEIDSGPFERTVELPDGVDLQSIEAKLRDGFLWISIARK